MGGFSTCAALVKRVGELTDCLSVCVSKVLRVSLGLRSESESAAIETDADTATATDTIVDDKGTCQCGSFSF